ncbi:hypothetical protein BZG36_03152 [Bifiguratus adelaidae]|uniref:SNRNP25 ubiquitin-like domain-containing protein n=1 Tax=Bifiguratus adelaidae TaxID=1938954 RepID=A0A261Y1E4_9FUNG|nr:hypothetical protein BZG36_03152 [Bifiguratus adelaidae]
MEEEEEHLKRVIDSLLEDVSLQDIDRTTTLEELNLLIAHEQGQAFRVTIDRGVFGQVELLVHQADTLKTIKRRFQGRVDAATHKPVHWKHVWRTYDLQLAGKILRDDTQAASAMALNNGDVLAFVRKRRDKESKWRA